MKAGHGFLVAFALCFAQLITHASESQISQPQASQSGTVSQTGTANQSDTANQPKTMQYAVNDMKCIALSPVYIVAHTGSLWWYQQKDHASFFHSSTVYPSGRKPSGVERAGFAAIVWPAAAVIGAPVDLVLMSATGGWAVTQHAAELLVLPFGKTLKFHRLDDSDLSGATR